MIFVCGGGQATFNELFGILQTNCNPQAIIHRNGFSIAWNAPVTYLGQRVTLMPTLSNNPSLLNRTEIPLEKVVKLNCHVHENK